MTRPQLIYACVIIMLGAPAGRIALDHLGHAPVRLVLRAVAIVVTVTIGLSTIN